MVANPFHHLPLLPTTVVGSYPQPDWLIDREQLAHRVPPRVPVREIWRVPEQFLEQAQDDATRLAIRDMEQAGIDIISDGESRRESYSNRFANALEGIDLAHPAQGLSRRGQPDVLPRVTGPLKRRGPVQVRDVEFLRANTDRPIKITVPGPFTMSQQAVDNHYGDERCMALDFAAAVNQELRDLAAAGADVVQIDEPYLQARLEPARRYAVEAINCALEGVPAVTALHTCFGYGAMVKEKPANQYPFLEELADAAVDHISIETAQPELDLSVLARMGSKTMILGVLDLSKEEVEPVETIIRRVQTALRYIPAERLIIAPDCGMKYLSRWSALGKLQAMTQAVQLLRQELAAR